MKIFINAVKKLRSKRGASIVIAVIFAFFAMTVGTVLISGAVTARLAGRNATAVSLGYNSAESAARLLRDSIEGVTYDEESGIAASSAVPEMAELVETLYNNMKANNLFPVKLSFTPDESMKFKKDVNGYSATAECIMDENGTISCRVSAQDSSAILVLTVNPSREIIVEPAEGAKLYKYSWGRGIISQEAV